MADVGLGVGYWHPRTQFRLHAVKRTSVKTEDGNSHLVPIVDVDLQAGVVPDPNARQNVYFDVGLLEKLDLQFAFDDRGLLESLNSEAGRDVTPVLSVVGKVVGLVALAAAVTSPSSKPPPSLEEQWDEAHPQLAQTRSALERRVLSLLQTLTHDDAEPTQVVACGDALSVLQSYQASIGQLRREWIASQAGIVKERTWRLAPDDALLIDAVELPETLHRPSPPPAQIDAYGLGVMLAVADGQRHKSMASSGQSADNDDSSATDMIFLRGSRPAQVGVYLRVEDDSWQLQRETVLDLDLVDEHSSVNALSLDGSWLRTKKMTLAYHPDKSLKTFGLTSTSSASSVATSIGGVIDSASTSAKAWLDRPSAEAQELDKVRTQLDLRTAQSELEVLAATRARAAEVAALEQEKKIRDARP